MTKQWTLIATNSEEMNEGHGGWCSVFLTTEDADGAIAEMAKQNTEAGLGLDLTTDGTDEG